MAISSLGVGSGLDLNQIVGQLVAAEREPKEQRLNQREERIDAQISAFGELTSSVDQVGSVLGDLSGFEPEQSASVSDEGVANVTVTGDADNGDFSLEVNQLAQSQIVASAPGDFDSADDAVGAGELTIQVGSGAAVTLDVEEGMTLRDLRNAINDSDAGVRASIVNDGSGARLVMEANETGADNQIQVTADGDPGGLGRLDSNNMVETRAAQDAEAVINGLAVTSSSNTLSDTIEGLEIELTGVSNGPTTVSVSEDRDELESLLQGFVENYNALIGRTSELTAYDPEEDEAAILAGDSTVRGVRSRLGNALIQPAENSEASNRTLAELGIVSNRDGTLSFDSTRFQEAMDRDGFENVSGTVREIAGNMREVTDSFTGRDGLIQVRQDGLQSDLSRIERQREDLDARIERMEAQWVRQFSRMDSMVAQLQATGDQLMGQLANTPLARNQSR
ncbi:flagellar filament capping protein FliD [Thioalkalivibrio sp. ALgr1]|uniref:flagellar filament capping protein FliD n=1 Tax=Thioalkalivibrio sp. ALgr1 TaxID=748655 RepID=UPI00036A5320|nr:flagellar filament capping protein FliD [Thioalkalivibrio sp. ALgr1]